MDLSSISQTVISDAAIDDIALVALGGMAAAIVTAALVSLVIWVITVIANWKIFTKAGEKGWKALIPIYNTVVLFRIAGVSPWWILGYFAAVIPFFGGLVALGITIYVMIRLAKAFGKDGGFAVGLILLNTIFMLILGFGKAQYQLKKDEPIEAAS